MFEFANERYYEIAGRRDIIGRTVREVQPEVEEQGVLEVLDRVYRTDASFQAGEMPLSLRRDDGSSDRRLINVAWQALRESDWSISGVLIHGVDVTAAVRARVALRQSEERFRLMANASAQNV